MPTLNNLADHLAIVKNDRKDVAGRQRDGRDMKLLPGSTGTAPQLDVVRATAFALLAVAGQSQKGAGETTVRLWGFRAQEVYPRHQNAVGVLVGLEQEGFNPLRDSHSCGRMLMSEVASWSKDPENGGHPYGVLHVEVWQSPLAVVFTYPDREVHYHEPGLTLRRDQVITKAVLPWAFFQAIGRMVGESLALAEKLGIQIDSSATLRVLEPEPSGPAAVDAFPISEQAEDAGSENETAAISPLAGANAAVVLSQPANMPAPSDSAQHIHICAGRSTPDSQAGHSQPYREGKPSHGRPRSLSPRRAAA